MKTKLVNYFVYVGVASHLLLLIIIIWQPRLFGKLVSMPMNYYYSKSAQLEIDNYSKLITLSIEEQIDKVFFPWQPKPNLSNKKQTVQVNGVSFSSLKLAVKSLKSGDELQIYDGIYTKPFKINEDNITIIGYGHVVFEKSAYDGKAFVVSKGENLTIKNIECRFIAVKDKNGACIRQEGKNITLDHVYFHHSENGILEKSKRPGNIYIFDSRFELLGKNGKAHGVYSSTANLYINNSLFIATKSEGHAIKNRAEKTFISNSLITSLSSDDSRLIDIPNGGVLSVERSLLHQGPLSVNGQAIAFGMEGVRYEKNEINITNNIILLERIKKNTLLVTAEVDMTPIIEGNIVVNTNSNQQYKNNSFYQSRSEAALSEYPSFPKEICQFMNPCPLI
ncbi:hypothetical protein A9Q74_02850 [Colwellia sp. 39_35_sub15_T18]|nr:hypothetical protein A9Q74_02850 [Colwellia sp. 39_35_sub15_T18]